LIFFAPYFFSQYIAKKIIRLGYSSFPRRTIHMLTG
jgi:hypothetical protein